MVVFIVVGYFVNFLPTLPTHLGGFFVAGTASSILRSVRDFSAKKLYHQIK
jgi:hypothetical protein